MSDADAILALAEKLAESQERNWEAVSELSAAANRITLAAEKMTGAGNTNTARVTVGDARGWAVVAVIVAVVVTVWAVGEVRVASAGREELRSRIERIETVNDTQQVYIQQMREQRARSE